MTDSRVTPFRAGGSASGESFDPETAAGAVTLLADISEFQPNLADAAYLTWSKAIVVRAMYGAAHDDKAWYGGQRRALLHQGGVKFLGIYAYLAGSQSGAAQAQAFHKLVGPIQAGEVFIADFEEGSKAVLAAWYNAMLSLYGSGIGKYLWTYSGLSFGEAQGVLPVQWIAAYQASEPSSPHTLWQFTDRYSVPGVGSCDCSRFHGTVDHLAALAWQPGKPAPAPAPSPVPSPLKEQEVIIVKATISNEPVDFTYDGTNLRWIASTQDYDALAKVLPAAVVSERQLAAMNGGTMPKYGPAALEP